MCYSVKTKYEISIVDDGEEYHTELPAERKPKAVRFLAEAWEGSPGDIMLNEEASFQ